MLGLVGGSWSRGLCPLVQNLRRLLAPTEHFSRVKHTNMKKVKISIQIPFFLRFVWIFLGNFGLVSIQITDFSRFVWTIFRKTPEKPKKVHTYLQKQAICMDFHKKLIIPCHSWIPHNCLAGRRAAAPLWPVGCPMPRGEGEVKSWQSLECWKKRGGWQPRSGRKTLYFPGALWHPRPEGASTRTALLERGYHRGSFAGGTASEG